MFLFTVRFILRNRVLHVTLILLLTAIMGFYASKIELSYEYARMLPKKDITYKEFESFREKFKDDGNAVFIGVETDKMKNLDFFLKWKSLSDSIGNIKGVKNVFSFDKIVNLEKDTLRKKFVAKPLFKNIPTSQEDYELLYHKALNLKIYEGYLFQSDRNQHVMFVWIHDSILNSNKRIQTINTIQQNIENFEKDNNVDLHFSGLPYIRTFISKKIKDELLYFTFISLIVAMIMLFFFFRSLRAVLLPIIVVVIGVIWSLGIMVLLGYKISVLTGILPPILIIIGIENCIYILTRYHKEILLHGSQLRAIVRVIQRVGLPVFLTNLTTAVGFAAFISTGNVILVEFGIIALISIVFMFFLSIILIPVLFSFFEAPKKRHTKHLQRIWIDYIYKIAKTLSFRKQKLVFLFTIFLFLISIIGLLQLEQQGRMVDDIPETDIMTTDLKFFEENLKGVLPLEIIIDTRKKNGLLDFKTIKKLDKLDSLIAANENISKPLSYVELLKFAKQSYYNGNPKMYQIPTNNERAFILSYIPRQDTSTSFTLLKSIIDTNFQVARVTCRLKNLTTKEIKVLKNDLKNEIDSIFPKEKYDVLITGSTVIFLKGSSYLMKNLFVSLIIAVIIIALLMWMLFRNFSIVFISMIPNVFPLLMTAALMGFIGIDIKPSTIIIYSIALGISVDSAIHILSRYRYFLGTTDNNVTKSVDYALKETSVGMVYSGIVLILGFSVFTLSSFGGTQALGFLVAFTLTIALFSNLILLPSLLIRFKESSGKKDSFISILSRVQNENNNNGNIH